MELPFIFSKANLVLTHLKDFILKTIQFHMAAVPFSFMAMMKLHKHPVQLQFQDVHLQNVILINLVVLLLQVFQNQIATLLVTMTLLYLIAFLQAVVQVEKVALFMLL